jgi:hypothetical protein
VLPLIFTIFASYLRRIPSLLEDRPTSDPLLVDVWENGPFVDIGILGLAAIATPHIAGYSLQSKLQGMILFFYCSLK